LQPTEPGGVSTLGAFVNTTADNLRGQGANIHDTVIKLSQAFSALGDHSNDLFSTIKNLSILVSALQNSTDLVRQLNQNLASVTGLLANDPNEVGHAVADLNDVRFPLIEWLRCGYVLCPLRRASRQASRRPEHGRNTWTYCRGAVRPGNRPTLGFRRLSRIRCSRWSAQTAR
jgi:hypothetical protein